MNTETDAPSTEAKIRALMEEWTEAVCAKDLEKVMLHYAPDVQVFDLMQTHVYIGAARLRRHMEGWFSAWQGPIHCERRDLAITAGDEVAFSSCLTHNSSVGPDGQELDIWVRVTIGFRKIEGLWKVVHEHVSMPFDMETMKACTKLEL